MIDSEHSAYTLPLTLLALYIRICISFAPHSGYRDAPTFGDYEAQRHWQVRINTLIQMFEYQH